MALTTVGYDHNNPDRFQVARYVITVSKYSAFGTLEELENIAIYDETLPLILLNSGDLIYPSPKGNAYAK